MHTFYSMPEAYSYSLLDYFQRQGYCKCKTADDFLEAQRGLLNYGVPPYKNTLDTDKWIPVLQCDTTLLVRCDISHPLSPPTYLVQAGRRYLPHLHCQRCGSCLRGSSSSYICHVPRTIFWLVVFNIPIKPRANRGNFSTTIHRFPRILPRARDLLCIE